MSSSLGGQVYALSDVVVKNFYGPFEGVNPGKAGSEHCESLFAHSKPKRMIAERHLARNFLSIQQALEEGDLENASWQPGTDNPADGLTKVRNEVAPLSRLLEPGRFHSGPLRPLKGVAWKA